MRISETLRNYASRTDIRTTLVDWQQPFVLIGGTTQIVVEIKQRLEHKTHFERQVTLSWPELFDWHKFALNPGEAPPRRGASYLP